MLIEKTEEGFQPLECPFCATEGIKFGATICRGCQADIRYENIEKSTNLQNWLIPIAVAAVSGVVAAGLYERFSSSGVNTFASFAIFFVVAVGAFVAVRKVTSSRGQNADWLAQPTKVVFSRSGKSQGAIFVPIDL